jgi:starch phosphorylase
MQRQVQDYSRDLYIPAAVHGEEFAADSYKVARGVSHWKGKLRFNWHHIHLEANGPKDGKLAVGETVSVTAKIRLGLLDPKDVSVEITHGREVAGALTDFETLPMELVSETDGTLTFRGTFVPKTSGSYGYGVRIVPNDPHLINKHELALIRWA